MNIEEGKEVQAKGMHYIFNKTNAENLTNHKKDLPIQVQEASWKPNRHDQNRTSPWHIIAQKFSMENKERIFKALREKNQITHKSKSIKKPSKFLNRNLKSKKGME
jgi:hypothetical protein